MKILIIEDEKELVGVIKKFLEPEGFLCETACSYFEAEDSLSSYIYDIIGAGIYALCQASTYCRNT